jgi:hypothetical protein
MRSPGNGGQTPQKPLRPTVASLMGQRGKDVLVMQDG